MEDLIRAMQMLASLYSSQNAPNIDISSTDFKPNRNFRLYVGVAGVVVGKDAEGGAINRYFIAGYHPISMKEITKTGTTATDLGACY